MPRGGSKKGEHRGNAKKRVHETPNEIMHSALAAKTRKAPSAKVVERRVEVAHMLNGPSAEVADMTPKDVLLSNMHYWMESALSLQQAVQELSDDEAKFERMAEAEREIQRYRSLASEDAYKVAPFIHPRLAAVAVGGNAGESANDIVSALLDDIDARQRDPRVIEHNKNERA